MPVTMHLCLYVSVILQQASGSMSVQSPEAITTADGETGDNPTPALSHMGEEEEEEEVWVLKLPFHGSFACLPHRVHL